MKKPKVKRPVLQFRVRQETYSRLTEAAAMNKVSISREAEERIESSFESQNIDPRIEKAIERAVRKGLKNG